MEEDACPEEACGAASAPGFPSFAAKGRQAKRPRKPRQWLAWPAVGMAALRFAKASRRVPLAYSASWRVRGSEAALRFMGKVRNDKAAAAAHKARRKAVACLYWRICPPAKSEKCAAPEARRRRFVA